MNDFQPTVPMPDDAMVGGNDEPRLLDIRFTGSGSEYFRIWIVNLLLTVVTLTLYHPWAKLRRLRYFHGNTLVDDHPLDFHGDPKKMLRGHLLVGALLGLYTLANRVSPQASLFALALFAGLWPALMRASLQFRLANTSWRGMRLHFTGSLGGAYGAMLPLFVPALLVVALPLGTSASGKPGAAFWGLTLLLFGSLAAVPWWLWRLKRYQVGHIEFGGQRSELRVGPGAFYGLFLRWSLVTLLTALVIGALVGLVVGWRGRGGGPDRAQWVAMATMAGIMLAYATVFVTAYPYYVSRMQNLVWNATASRDLQFSSALRFRPLLALSLRNLVLMLLTLGLYWPFARVALARLRLEAVVIDSRISPDSLVSSRPLARTEATGDAAGDLFGIDFGL